MNSESFDEQVAEMWRLLERINDAVNKRLGVPHPSTLRTDTELDAIDWEAWAEL